MATSTRLAEMRWRIVPEATPRALRRCSQCNCVQAFFSSDRFRLNAQQRRVDVWLIYKCAVCATTWNRPVFSRQRPQDIGAALYERLLRNDPATAQAIASDVAGLRALGVAVDYDGRVQVNVEPGCIDGDADWRITFQVLQPCAERLDRLLSQAFGVSRSQVREAFDDGSLALLPNRSHGLRRPVRDGQTILVRRDSLVRRRGVVRFNGT